MDVVASSTFACLFSAVDGIQDELIPLHWYRISYEECSHSRWQQKSCLEEKKKNFHGYIYSFAKHFYQIQLTSKEKSNSAVKLRLYGPRSRGKEAELRCWCKAEIIHYLIWILYICKSSFQKRLWICFSHGWKVKRDRLIQLLQTDFGPSFKFTEQTYYNYC